VLCTGLSVECCNCFLCHSMLSFKNYLISR
jgi:hypothetical protein